MGSCPDGFFIGVVKIFAFLELEQKLTFFKGLRTTTDFDEGPVISSTRMGAGPNAGMDVRVQGVRSSA